MIEYSSGKFIFGTTSVSEKGQIVIPKSARDKFNIRPGDMVLIIGDEKKGLAIVKADNIMEFFTVITDPAEPEDQADPARAAAKAKKSSAQKSKKKK